LIDPQWAQGALLDPDAAREHITLGDVSENDVLIVISQSCDVVHVSYESEPDVELHVGRPIDAINGNNSFGKNPRTIDLDTTIDGKQRMLRILAHERKKIPRQALENIKPIGTIPDDDTYHLAKWTGNRYTRPALPDAFNKRRDKVKEAIAKLAKRDAKEVLGFYVALKTFDELPDGTDYEIFVLGVAPTVIANDHERFKKVISVTTAIANLLASCPGITVIEHEARSAANTSLDDIRYFKRLDLDYISERDGGEKPVEPA
jgi:hypothetical protein